jgi:lipid-binding SYLF domain-containing protein
MSTQKSAWETTKTSTKSGFDWAWKQLDKLGAPVNRISNKLGSEAFWPTDIGRESDKAARILRSFCKDGFYADLDAQSENEVVPAEQRVEIKGKQRVVKKIPQEVIRNAVGLCIFTTMRTGLWVSGAGGSGVLVARLEDGSWSPPSGVLLHTAGLGFLVGVDIYDCVIVINTREALRAFENPRFTVGGEFSAVAGPVGAGGLLETEIHKRQAPVFNYIKSRGFYAGVQVDGTVIIERNDENETFYGERLPAKDILAGKVRHPPRETRMLMETIKAAQGDSNVDQSLLPGDDEPAPGDYTLSQPEQGPQTGFGLPAPQDPDPFGAQAMEEAGLEIHEAGTGAKPKGEEFEFHPAATSPVYPVYAETRSGGPSIDAPASDHRASALGQVDDPGKRRSMDSATRAEDRDDSDVANGMSTLRVAAEEDAELEKSRDEFHTPDVEREELKIVDPIAEAGKEILEQEVVESERDVVAAQKEARQQEARQQEEMSAAHTPGGINSKGDEIVDEKRSSAMDRISLGTEELKKKAPPALPPR